MEDSMEMGGSSSAKSAKHYIRRSRRFDVGDPEPFPYEKACLYHERQHGFCRTLPIGDRFDTEELTRSILESGQIDPVAFWCSPDNPEEIYLVDGRHRVYVLCAHDKKYRSVIYTCPEDDIIAWIWAKNGARRQMDRLAKAQMEEQFRARLGAEADERIGRIKAGSGIDLLTKARKRGVPELVAAIEDKTIALDVGARAAANLSPEGQLEFVAAAKSGKPARATLQSMMRDSAWVVKVARNRSRLRPTAVSIHVELTAAEAADRYRLRTKAANPSDKLIAELGPIVGSLRAAGFRIHIGTTQPRNL